MVMVMIDGPMITQFVEDTNVFSKCITERFKMLDKDNDGLISLNDLSKGGLGNWLIALDDDYDSDADVKKAYDSIFETYAVDGSNSIHLKQFQTMVTDIMLALARGIGNNPISMLLDDTSLLLNACA